MPSARAQRQPVCRQRPRRLPTRVPAEKDAALREGPLRGWSVGRPARRLEVARGELPWLVRCACWVAAPPDGRPAPPPDDRPALPPDGRPPARLGGPPVAGAMTSSEMVMIRAVAATPSPGCFRSDIRSPPCRRMPVEREVRPPSPGVGGPCRTTEQPGPWVSARRTAAQVSAPAYAVPRERWAHGIRPVWCGSPTHWVSPWPSTGHGDTQSSSPVSGSW